ncbi:hypothetical protein C4K23_1938 [Pseudomonas chlororaphis]|nr:hypothetical protein C4K23_1938 [Pseudomonas chlororaphis]
MSGRFCLWRLLAMRLYLLGCYRGQASVQKQKQHLIQAQWLL